MNLSAAIRDELETHEMTIEALAERIGIDRRTLSARLNGHRDFSWKEIGRMADCFGLSASELIRRAEQAAATATLSSPVVDDGVALAGSALALSTDEADGPSEAELEAHVDACDGCTCAEDALEHARLAYQEAA